MWQFFLKSYASVVDIPFVKHYWMHQPPEYVLQQRNPRRLTNIRLSACDSACCCSSNRNFPLIFNWKQKCGKWCEYKGWWTLSHGSSSLPPSLQTRISLSFIALNFQPHRRVIEYNYRQKPSSRHSVFFNDLLNQTSVSESQCCRLRLRYIYVLNRVSISERGWAFFLFSNTSTAALGHTHSLNSKDTAFCLELVSGAWILRLTFI